MNLATLGGLVDRLLVVQYRLAGDGAGAVLVRANNGAVDHRKFVVGVGCQVLQETLPHPRLGPAAEPAMDAPNRSVRSALGNSGAIAREHRFDQSTLARSRRHGRPGPAASP